VASLYRNFASFLLPGCHENEIVSKSLDVKYKAFLNDLGITRFSIPYINLRCIKERTI